jgi:hypothetical protein
MSLTTELKRQDSPIFQFLNDNLDRSLVSGLIVEHNSILSRLPILNAPPGSNLPLVGTAMSYAFRWQIHSPETWLKNSLAWWGARQLDLADDFNQVIHNAESENQKDFCCLLMACFEQVYRGRLCPELTYLIKLPSPEKLLLEMPNYAASVADIQQLRRGFKLKFIGLNSEPIYINPTFDGSSDVHGADAQLIVGTRLIDVRTTHKRRPLTLEGFYQQIAYCLLDYSDEYGLTKIVWVYPRQQTFLSYYLDRIIKNLAQLRADLEEYLGSERWEGFDNYYWYWD